MIEPKVKLSYPRKCYTLADYYLSYQKYITRDTPYDVPFSKFKDVLTEYFKFLRDEVMLNSKEVRLPCRLGTLLIVKHQPKEFTGKSLRVDFKTSKDLGKTVYHLNEHSNGWKFRFYWSKKSCLLKNKSLYQFVATRQNKRDLAQIIFNKEQDYPEV